MRLSCITETNFALKDFALCLSLVPCGKQDCEHATRQDDEQIAHNTRQQSWSIDWRIRLPEYGRAKDTSDRSETNLASLECGSHLGKPYSHLQRRHCSSSGRRMGVILKVADHSRH